MKWLKTWCTRLPWIDISQVASLLLLALALWAIAYSLFKDAVTPDSQMFSLAVLFILGKVAGVLVNLIRIPPMLGMLAVGVLLKNVGFLNLSDDYKSFASILRQMALVNILLPAGLGLDPTALRRMSGMVLSLALVPAAVEVVAVTVFSHFLMNLPWLWGVLLGLLMGAVSPAVIIPCLFELQDRGYGVNKGIHTLVIAASTLDDIACIACFGIVIGIIFSTGSLLMQILEGPIVIAIGFAYGIVFGVVAQYLPHHKDEHLVSLRTLVIGAVSVLAAVGSQAIGYGGAGTLGCIVSAFVACLGWRRQGWDSFNPVKANFSLLWRFFEPISFGLIGMEVDFSVLEADVVIWGSLSMILALIIRMLVSMIITRWSDLNLKENIFVAVSWIPKATVQAALGPVALDYARQTDSAELKSYANAMLIVAVLSIIITSPIGAFAIMQLGPRLLHCTPPTGQNTKHIEITDAPDRGFKVALDVRTNVKKHSYYNTI